MTLAVPEEVLATAEAIALEPVKVGWSEDEAVETIAAAAERATALALGPGLGRGPGAASSCGRCSTDSTSRRGRRRRTLRSRAGIAERGTVLTPHAGELARLLGRDSEWVGEHRLEAARTAADRVRRDRAPEGGRHAGRVARRLRHGVRPGHAALATAGTGDVLTGVVGRIPGEGSRRADGRCSGGGCARTRRAARPPPGGNGRERPARSASGGARS